MTQTQEQYRALAELMLHLASQEIAKAGFETRFFVLKNDQCHAVELPPGGTNIASVKQAAMKAVGDMAVGMDADAIIIISDAFKASSKGLSPEQIAEASKLGIAEARKRGLVGEPEEVIFCQIIHREGVSTYSQPYIRTGEHDIELKEIEEQHSGIHLGRFGFNPFTEQKANA
jgi:hypothetical protein